MATPIPDRQSRPHQLFGSDKVQGLRIGGAIVTTITLLVAARLLPAHGVGLALRMGLALVTVLLLPGALIARVLGWPNQPALLVAIAIPWSLVAHFLSLIVTFASHRSLSLAIALLGVISGIALVAVVTTDRRPGPSQRESLITLGLIAGGLLFGLVLWLVAPPIHNGDALEHLARTRKLAELSRLGSGVTELFKGAGLHPGYAFPLWHGSLALIARLAGVDPAVVVRWLPALLAPLSFLATYAAGAALFRNSAAGVATVGGQVAYFGLANKGTGQFLLMAQPHQVTLLLLVPSLLAILFTFVETGRRPLLASLAAASLSIAVVHPSYALFTAFPVLGFLGANLLLNPRDRPGHARIALGLATMAIPAGAFFLWLVPAAVRATPSFTPGPTEVTRQLASYGHQIQMVGRSFRMAPMAISTAGPAAVVALLAIPFAALAFRARWAAYVLAAGLTVLVVLLVPALFRELTNVVSISQGRRFVLFMPWSFAFAGGMLLLGNLRLAGTLAAFGAGLIFQRFYPGDFSYASGHGGGPTWPVWFALLGGGAALIAGAVFRHRPQRETPVRWWAAATAIAFIMPLSIAGLTNLHASRDRVPLPQGLIAALRADVKKADVVFAPARTSYSLVAYVPVYVAAVPVGHAWDRPKERIRDVEEFFSPQVSHGEQERILRKYGAGWLVVDERRPPVNMALLSGELTYRDRLYALYRVETLGAPAP